MKIRAGFFRLPEVLPVRPDATLDSKAVRLGVARLEEALRPLGTRLVRRSRSVGPQLDLARVAADARLPWTGAGGYRLEVGAVGIRVETASAEGWRAAVATLRQLLRQCGTRLPCLEICDWPEFARRGVMLDVSRGRVPRIETLLELAGDLADLKINEFQLYLEHTFAYRRHRRVWAGWGAITGGEIRRLDRHCRRLGIDLVPNQNSFGHLRWFLARPELRHLGEVQEPYAPPGASFLRRPSTLAPGHPGTLPFLRGLFDELLPNFSSRRFNVGCDETWDLGRGRSREACQRRGQGRVYLDFLKAIHREVRKRGRTMMFWGDIILKYPRLVPELPSGVIALNWGYEAAHPFQHEARRFAKSGIPFYVCPGTSTWMTFVGRHDNALANLSAAAAAGRKHGAVGYLITDWGDGGHPQPLAVSYWPYLAGAALSWNGGNADGIEAALSRDVFQDATGRMSAAARALGLAHRLLKCPQRNSTALGTTLAAPTPESRELFCHEGLSNFLHITPRNLRRTLRELERQRRVLAGSKPRGSRARLLRQELDLAARMAVLSCRYMQWQQAVRGRKRSIAGRLAAKLAAELARLDSDFNRAWPHRNKGTTAQCSEFLQW
ncbi:MAG: family 20 glycosylhydrolase, partial [Verrucomicrobiota bacterium]